MIIEIYMNIPPLRLCYSFQKHELVGPINLK